MNTKFFLLLISLLLTNPTCSVSTKSFSQSVAASFDAFSNNTPSTEDIPEQEDFTWKNKAHESESKHAEKAPKQSEDGKHHHFHFSRIRSVKRRRNFLIIASKILLTVLHVCVFIYCFMHAFH